MAPHSSTLAWKIPWTEEPGGLQSMGLIMLVSAFCGIDETLGFYCEAVKEKYRFFSFGDCCFLYESKGEN